MGTTIGIVLIVVLIALVAISRRGQKATEITPPVRRLGPETTQQKFHAVSIQIAEGVCSAAKEIHGERFLAAAAPRLPLPGCDAAECKCRFIHHADRRSGIERRGHYVPSGIAGTPAYAGKERRYRGDRRGNEPQNFFT